MRKIFFAAGLLSLIVSRGNAQSIEQRIDRDVAEKVAHARQALSDEEAKLEAKTKVCAQFFKCGTFEGPGRTTDSKGTVSEFQESTTITAVADEQARIDMIMGEETVHLDVKFQDDGRFTIMRSGHLDASGICKDSICTYAMAPLYQDDGEQIGNTGILRFGDGKLERFMFVVRGAVTTNQLSVLRKK